MRFVTLLILFSISSTFANPIDRFVRDQVVWEDKEKAARISDYTLTTLMIAPYGYALLEKEDRWKKVSTVAVMQLLNNAMNGYVKLRVGRERPDKSDNESFYSGHSSNAALGAAMVCGMNKHSCIPALLLAGTTGYLRMAADKHWMSDVVVGLGIGYLNGRYIPNLVVSF